MRTLWRRTLDDARTGRHLPGGKLLDELARRDRRLHVTTVEVDGDTRKIVALSPRSRHHMHAVRQAAPIVLSLRAAGVRGEARITTTGGSLLAPTDVRVRIKADGLPFDVLATCTVRGRIVSADGPWHVRVTSAGNTVGPLVNLAQPDDALRDSVLAALSSTWAPFMWASTYPDSELRVLSIDTDPTTGLWVLHTKSRAGDVAVHVGHAGDVYHLVQTVDGAQWREQGSDGESLLGMMYDVLDTDEPEDVFGPFLDKLRTHVERIVEVAR